MSDQLFHKLEDATAILVSKGVYYQRDVYTRSGTMLFTKHGQGFIRLYDKAGTSLPHVRLDHLLLPPGWVPAADVYGRLLMKLEALA